MADRSNGSAEKTAVRNDSVLSGSPSSGEEEQTPAAAPKEEEGEMEWIKSLSPGELFNEAPEEEESPAGAENGAPPRAKEEEGAAPAPAAPEAAPPAAAGGGGDGAVTEKPPVSRSEEPGGEDAAGQSGGGGRSARVIEEIASNLEGRDRISAYLLRQRILDPVALESAQEHKKEEDSPVSDTATWRVAAMLDRTDETAIREAAARYYGFPPADLDEHEINPDLSRTIGEQLSTQRREKMVNLGVVPWYVEPSQDPSKRPTVHFIAYDPARKEVKDLIENLKGNLHYASHEIVTDLTEKAFPKTNEYLERAREEEEQLDLGASYKEEETTLIDEEELDKEINRSKLINLFEAVLVEAVREGISDIHIVPEGKRSVSIRFREDGRLKEWHRQDNVWPEAMLAVVKDNCDGVDRFIKDAAQDGFIQRTIDNTVIRYRVSILPIASEAKGVRAESIVIRVLDDRKVISDLSKLGLQERALTNFRRAIRQPNGMVIMTGPTGSGKSTTLVAALHEVVTPEVNVLTVEDPVEYMISGVRQIKLSDKLHLGGALRAILRHDPDTVMVGEMRDRETAELAIKLSNTGHLTFSTLHTNDAPSAVSRLYKMGIEPFLLAYAINLIVAQRLIRTLCSSCKEPVEDPDNFIYKELGFTDEELAENTFYTTPEGEYDCQECGGQGFTGRRAISEALYFTEDIRKIIVDAGGDIEEDTIRDQAVSDGMSTLDASARDVMIDGQTSAEEMMHVVATGG